MPRYWFTQHWPHPIDPAEDVAWFVYLQHDYKAMGTRLTPGDQVVFYETGTGRPHLSRTTGRLVSLRKGRKGAVGTAEVSGVLRPSTTGQNVKDYGDGTRMNWGWEVPCGRHEWGRTVPLAEVLRILDRGTIRIRGGLLEIDRRQFVEFRNRMGLPLA